MNHTIIGPAAVLLVSNEFASRTCSGNIVRYEWRKSRRFAAGVVQLNSNHSSMSMRKFHYALKRRDMTV